jgi:hypothetical protein
MLSRIEQPAAELWTYFTNDTCRPTTEPSEPCTLGYYGVYVITAKTTAHISAAIKFAHATGVRLIVRNTGHDFIGRSTGWGALVVNVHSFQDVHFYDTYAGPGPETGYTGSAVSIGAGVQGRSLLTRLHAQKNKQVVVTGECPVSFVSSIHSVRSSPLTELDGWASGRTPRRRRPWPSNNSRRLRSGQLTRRRSHHGNRRVGKS